MGKFLYIYTGGSPPADREAGEKVMQAWMAYFGRMGDRIVDGGIGAIRSTNAVAMTVVITSARCL